MKFLILSSRYAKTVNAIYMETSAKLNRNVEAVFLELAKSKSYLISLCKFCVPDTILSSCAGMLQSVKEEDGEAGPRPKAKKGLIIEEEDDGAKVEGGKCC